MFEHLDEKQRLLLAGGMARVIGRGGPTVVAETAAGARRRWSASLASILGKGYFSSWVEV